MAGIEYVIEAVDDFSRTFSQFGNGLRGLEKAAGTLTGVGAGMTAVGAGLAAGLGAAVKTGMEFDAQMSKVQAISGATTQEFEAMREQALELGASTSKSASEVATGFQEMAAMGFNANEVMAAMPGIIAASEASGADMAQVASVMASTLNSFGLEASEASRVADVLAKTANISAADITDMQYALKYAAPSANALGISLEELAAATGIMTNAGMEGEQAGTTLRMALQRLVDPPKEAANAMDDLGFSAIDSQGNFKSLETIITELGTSMNGMTEAQKLATLSQIFGTESASGMLNVIAAGPAKFNEFTTALQNSAGSSAEAAAIMKDNLAGSMEQLTGAFESLAINISDVLAPAIQWVAEKVTGLVEWFNGLSNTTQTVVVVVAALAAGFGLIAGPLVILISLLPSLIAGISTLATIFGVTSGVLLSTVGVIGLVVAAVAVLAAIVIANWDDIKAWTINAWNAVMDFLSGVWDSIIAGVTAAWDWIMTYFGSVFEAIAAIYSAGFEAISTLVSAAWENVKTIFQAAVDTISAVISAAWEAIKTIFSAAFLIIYNIVTGQWDKVGEVFNAATNKLRGIIGDVWDRIKSIWTNAFGEVVSNTSGAITKVLNVFNDLKSQLLGKWDEIKADALEMGKNIMQGLIDGVKSMVTKTVDAVKGAVNSAVDAAKDFLGIHSPSRVFMELGGYTGEGFAIGLENMASKVADAANAMSSAAVGGTGYSTSGTASIAANSGMAAASQGAGQTIIIQATYVDQDAVKRLAAEVSRQQGRLIGGKRS